MLDHHRYLRLAIDASREARSSGNTPFGAILVDADGAVLLTQGNVEITERTCTGHAETALAARASHAYDKATLHACTLYSTAEPCAMCAGAIYWANIGTVVYGISESRLLELTGDSEQNPTLALPCREVFARGQRDIAVVGPLPELELDIVAVHEGYWSGPGSIAEGGTPCSPSSGPCS